MYKQYYKNYLYLIVSDFLITILTLVVAAHLRLYLPGEELLASAVVPHYSIYVITPLSLLIVFTMTGAYNFRIAPKLSDHFRQLVFSYAVWGWFFVGVLYFSFREISRLLIIYFAILNFVILVMCRYFIWKFLAASEKNANAARVLIFGSPQSSSKLCEMILKGLPGGYTVEGFSDFKAPDNSDNQTPFLGTAEFLPEIVRQNEIEIVIMSLDQTSLSSIRPLVIELIRIPVRVFLTQDYSTLPFLELEINRIGDVVLVGILEPVINGWNRLLKRLFDLFFSSLALILLWPLFILIAIAIKIDSSGPVIFPARRIGNGGKLFTMYKFRTMINSDSDSMDKWSRINYPNIYKMKNDPRITRVGIFLRRWSMDELPQLFNVLKGEMSLVGPRPEQPPIAEEYEPWQWQRIQVPPGITGWWQISGRCELPMHLNTHLDIHYVANYSILLDIKILFLTVFEVIRGRGAY